MTGAMYPGHVRSDHQRPPRSGAPRGRHLRSRAWSRSPPIPARRRCSRSRSASSSRAKCCSDIPNVEVTGYTGLTVDFARQHGLRVVVRGLRAVSDFEFEFQLATMSRHLSDKVDYVFLTPTEQFNFISSTLVREIASLGGNVAQFVHPDRRSRAATRLGEARAPIVLADRFLNDRRHS